MNKKINAYLSYAILITTITPSWANADGLNDLNRALSALTGQSSIQAKLESSHNQIRDREDDSKATTGFIELTLADGAPGFQLTYSNTVLDKIESEQVLKDQDEEANTPTTNAMNRLDTTQLNQMLSAAPSLARFINKASFVDETPTEFQNQSARRLTFDLPLESLVDSAEVREYVDEFEGKYSVIIDNKGVPLQSILSFNGSGSAFVIFSVEMSQTNTTNYQQHGDRLVMIKQETQRSSTSTFADTESTEIKRLTVLPKEQLAKTR